MKAMIFAAGLGTRLKPLTDSCPKALVPVGGRPMLEHVILRLKSAGFDHIVVNIHHFGQQIIDFLEQQQCYGIRIDVSDERDCLLDTGGGIKKASAFLEGDEPFLVHNVDILSDIDLRGLYDEHVRFDRLATLVVSRRETSRYFLFDDQRRLRGWENKKTGEVRSEWADFRPELYSEYAFDGIHMLSPRVFQLLEKWSGKFSIVDFYLSVVKEENIIACPQELKNWLDIGKPETLVKAEELLALLNKTVL